MAAVVAAQAPVAMEHERDVAVGTTEGRPAGAAVQRGSDPAAVEEQDRLAAVLGERAELGKQRRRKRIAGLAAQVDDLHRRQLPAEPLRQLDALERSPALGPRRRAAVECYRALERRALGRDRPRVVAWIGLLLVGRVVLLVDADQADPLHRREDRRARADHHPRLAAGDPLALVAPLGLAQAGVQDRDRVAEARAETTDRLRRERDLGDEHDRPEAALEGRCRRLEIDLGLAAPGRAVEQEVSAPLVERGRHPGERQLLRLAQRLRLRLSLQSGQTLHQRVVVDGRAARRASRRQPALPEAEGGGRRPLPRLEAEVLSDEGAALVEQDAVVALAGGDLAPGGGAAARTGLDLVVRHG